MSSERVAIKLLVHNVSHADLNVTLRLGCACSETAADCSEKVSQSASSSSVASGCHSQAVDDGLHNQEFIARPRFSRFKFVCAQLLAAVQCGASLTGLTYPDESGSEHVVGFQFDTPQKVCHLSDFRVRDDIPVCVLKHSAAATRVEVCRVFFPLIAALLPKWLSLHSTSATPVPSSCISLSPPLSADFTLETAKSRKPQPKWGEAISLLPLAKADTAKDDSVEHTSDAALIADESVTGKSQLSAARHSEDIGDAIETEPFSDFLAVAKVRCLHKLFLVSGAGSAQRVAASGVRLADYTEDDSTQILSSLLRAFVAHFYAWVVCVTQFHSGSNIFSYTANVRFVHQMLRPAIDDNRVQLAAAFGKHWSRYWHLCLALCDGSPARLSALTEGLRLYKPCLLHFVYTKTLWHSFPLCVDRLWLEDVEYLTFHDLETFPALTLCECDDSVQSVVYEMRKWKTEFTLKGIRNPQSEMSEFWLRKSFQPVLSIVVIQKPTEPPRYFRGVNMEVAMPTGSLCAERNAIGNALVGDPSIRREHFKMVAVLALPELGDSATAVSKQSTDSPMASSICLQSVMPPPLTVDKPTHHYRFKGGAKQSPYMRRTTQRVKHATDPNPRGPCGACSEWLSKLAAINPSFKIVTFSDERCQQVFIKHFIHSE